MKCVVCTSNVSLKETGGKDGAVGGKGTSHKATKKCSIIDSIIDSSNGKIYAVVKLSTLFFFSNQSFSMTHPLPWVTKQDFQMIISRIDRIERNIDLINQKFGIHIENDSDEKRKRQTEESNPDDEYKHETSHMQIQQLNGILDQIEQSTGKFSNIFKNEHEDSSKQKIWSQHPHDFEGMTRF